MTKPSATIACASLLLAVVGFEGASAQDIEPRAFSNAPIGMNFAVVGYARTEGGLPTDGSLPLTDIDLHTDSAVVGLVHVFELGGQSAKIDLIAPYTSLSGDAKLNGAPVERNIEGFSDPKVRLSGEPLRRAGAGVNDDFYVGRRREQDSIYSAQGHVIYSFHNGWWASADATYFNGGRTTIDGTRSNGVTARTGNEFDLYGIAWQHRWGAGL